MKKLLLALTAMGCATVPPRPLEYERPQETLREAAALGAERVPTARQHLWRATEQLELARQMENLRDRRAALMLERAQADADVAVALAREAAMRADALRARDELAKLRGEP